MIENPENFDNICINSQDDDINEEKKLNYNNIDTNTSTLKSDLSPDLYYFNGKKNFGKNYLEKVLIDESSNDSDEVTFIREISKPLLNTTKSKNRLKRRLNLQNKKKWTKVVGVCFVGTIILGMLIFLVILLLPNHILKYLNHEIWNRYLFRDFNNMNSDDIVSCDEISTEDIWIKNFPHIISEGAARLLKINDDDILDVVFPFGTNILTKIGCRIYYPGQEHCAGGLIALDGKTGDMLWRYNGVGEMYALVCLEDLNKDGWIDCLGAGRQGTFAAVSGRNGNELWGFHKNVERNKFMNLYTAQFIDDIDNDGVRDVVQIHGGDPLAQPTEMNRLIAKLIIFSGRTGRTLVSLKMPDDHESYYSPQIMNLGDGVKKVLFGTGGETFPGSLFEVDLNKLTNPNLKDQIRPMKLYDGPHKGVITPPVLVDLNSDGRADIVMCPFGDECFAIDGVTMKIIWKFNSVKNFETYCTPAAGFYNDDDVPDIFIQIFVGLGYPVYFYGETLILDGRNGKLLKNLTRSNNAVISSPLVLSMEGHGNDLFLYWLQLCKGHENEINETPFQNLPQYMLSRAHFCKIRFNTTTTSLFLIHGKHLKNQSISYGHIYNSERYFHIEYNVLTNRSEQVENFLIKNPEYRQAFEQYSQNLEKNDLSETDLNESDDTDYHNSIIKEQRLLQNINLDDDLVHRLIDFNEPSNDEEDSLRKDEYSNYDNPFDKKNRNFRYVRDSDEKLFRSPRHNGPHDGEGLQRLISTGTLAPPILDANDKYSNHSMDIIFNTYWNIPKEIVLQTKMEQKCNEKWATMEGQRFRNGSKFYYYDNDHYLKYGNIYCAKKYGRKVPRSHREKQSTIFNSHFGQLTVYRKRLKCTCSVDRVQGYQRCGRILPLHLQTWPAYLGLGGTGYWNSSFFNLKFLKL